MKILNKITFAVALSITCFSANAQQDAMYTHYMYNTLMVNPGYAGSRDALTVTALHRSQWVDFKGAPITQTLTAHTPLRNQHIAIGVAVENDKIGPINNTSAFVDFAYIMKLTKKSKLSLGLNAGVNVLQASLTSLNADEQNDPILKENINNHTTPNFGFGAYYYRERFYAGVSIPNLLENNYSSITQANGNILEGKQQRHYFLIAGGLIHLNDDWDFKPTTYVKVTAAAPVEADLTASFIIRKKLLIGAMFRTGDAFGALIGVDITDQFHVGYSYDWSYGLQTFKYNQGSHEIVLRYDFIFFDKKRIRTPRYF